MERFVQKQNITIFMERLKAEPDAIRRVMLERLLALEKAKFVDDASAHVI
jgi:hypothetical protein